MNSTSPLLSFPGQRARRPTARAWSTFGLAAAVMIAAAACSSPAPPPGLSPVTDRSRLYYNDSGGIADSTRRVIRGVQEWRRVWDQATSRQEDPPPLPAVDFEQSMVVLVAAGRSSPGDRIRIDSVGVVRQSTAGGGTEEVLEVQVRTVRACGDFQGETFPVEIVRIQDFGGPVTFAERNERGAGCRQSSASGESPPDRATWSAGDHRDPEPPATDP